MTVAEANRVAIANGINIKISGYTSGSTNNSYRQSITEGTEVSAGSIVTVSFKSSVDVAD